MFDFQAAFKRIRPSIVGIGLRYDPEYKIFGSGFIIHPHGWIMTNRHVLEHLLVKTENGKFGIKPNAAAFLFIQAPPEEGFVAVGGMVASQIIELAVPPEENKAVEKEVNKKFRGMEPNQIIPPETPDTGICRIDRKNLPPEALPLFPAKIIHSKKVFVGMPVGIIGFPQGLSLPVSFDSISSVQLTPLLQIGVISGILPFSGVQKPDSFILDLFVNPGSSGSPLFLNDGNVVGVVYATRRDFSSLCQIEQNGEVSESHDFGVFTSAGLGLAIPSARFPEEWLSEEKQDSVQPNGV